MRGICLCLTAANPKDSLGSISRCASEVSMAEWRVDMVSPGMRGRVGTAAAGRSPRLPLVLTVRLQADGGRWGAEGETEEQREELLVSLLESGEWNWVDLEHDRPMAAAAAAAKSRGAHIIRSLHDFEGTLLDRPVSELAALVRSMAEDGAVPKIAARCRGSRQLLTLARLSIAAAEVKDKILLGMGEYGAPSRILSERFGSLWTYSLPGRPGGDEPAAAPGQLDTDVLKKLYRVDEITADTPLYAVAGNPAAHSRSPEIHNRWLQSAGLPGTYLPMRTDDAGALLEICDILGITGLSVTVPHKRRVMELCDYAGEAASRIGAANTLVRGGDGWRARNTDAAGFLADLRDALAAANASSGSDGGLEGRRVLIIGAGGAARAAAHALRDAGARLIILNRSVEKARGLASEAGGFAGHLNPQSLNLLDDVHIAVQTTSVGMHPNEEADPVPWWDFQGCFLAYDMIYEPACTLFLKRAAAAGVHTRGGAGMLEAQAALQFEIFTGRVPPDSPLGGLKETR